MKIKKIIRNEIEKVAKSLKISINPVFSVEIPKNVDHGDFSSNVALVSAKENKQKPMDLAELIVAKFKRNKNFSTVTVAKPGFINFTISRTLYVSVIKEILQAGEEYAKSDYGQGSKILIEFVSANPTGPLNIVSARAAAYGDTLYRVMSYLGYAPSREFYMNDAGNQVEILAESIELRFREILGERIGEMPDEAYHGEYIIELASRINTIEGSRILHMNEIERLEKIKDFALNEIRIMHEESLSRFGVEFESWISENSIRKTGIIEEVLSYLYEAKVTYEKDEAIWFMATKFDDEKDRVLLKADGLPTYFVPDIAYHTTKYDRGYNVIIDVLGPDHHGYIQRLIAALKALNYDETKMEFIFLQQVNLFNEGEKIKMSKRLGKIVTMDELVDEVGKDAARFFFIDRKPASHLNFDMELAKKQSSENPVFYCQYAHARICSILEKAKALPFDTIEIDYSILKKLNKQDEFQLIKKLQEFEEILINVAEQREPHRLTDYLKELSGMFHKYYHDFNILNKRTKDTTLARLYLVTAIRNILKIGFELIGVSAPEKMSKKE
ncbi:MAG: arginine--tRNA ligase [Candidatus Cloacimonadales bacterium]|jgi:arginyl-tRNA synthetase|nr:arginine--tRNA ligase [Candidatus Cloacimonadota bacterium]MDD2649755.1 arginine--tRNA ligase [Candidatus Cloacimonadota bacterium]MDD3501738.1 arginine--tRNA ligase [Candidatus Cloacimonadota bacterium]MDX9977589.1 arginine--tRNA ligase [Candidatus Cloacimonadales bacterium]